MIRKLLTLLNKLFPKLDHIIVQGFPVGESSAVEVANYLSEHYKLPVYFAVSSNKENLKNVGLLNLEVILLNESSLRFRLKYLTAKYLFFTHGSPLSSFSKRQTVINIWHGVLYKNVGKLIGHAGIPADITVATSELTRYMFSDAFGVSDSKVYTFGYPRNDILLRAKAMKSIIKKKIGKEIASFDKIIIWLPTYRKSVHGDIRVDGTDINNPFYIENFDVTSFNQVLNDHNALCIVKPHPMAPKFEHIDDLENLIFIDDKWILDKGITLYHLVGCTDILISDVSSIIIIGTFLIHPLIAAMVTPSKTAP